MSKSKTYKVAKGDTLEKIAKSHKIKDYKLIFDAPENAKLKKQRKQPKAIQPGDILVIPATFANDVSKAQLQKHIKDAQQSMSKRDKVRKDILSSQKELHAKFKAAKSRYNKAMTGLELTETMVMITADLSKIAKIQGKIDKGLVSLGKGNAELGLAIAGRSAKIMSPAIKSGLDKLRKSDNIVVKAAAELWSAKQNLTSGTFIGSRLQVLVSSSFFKQVASGKFDAAKAEFVKAYNWSFDKELEQIQKRFDEQVASQMVSFKAYDDSDQEIIKLCQAKLKEG